MSRELKLREYRSSDLSALGSLYRDAFPDEDLLPLVHALLTGDQPVQSSVATLEAEVVGHVIFTACTLEPVAAKVALLGPLCVAPDHQKQGIGSSLVHEGLERLTQQGTGTVLVLGDPAYYGRFGFKPDTGIAPPYPMPEEWREAWQSMQLHDEPEQLRGDLVVPGPWKDAALWGP
ncbi:GNAT family N-acetyltransferase [Roseibium sp.]|uniref:GNAT family N-acetyltransferase n=1 Tax=Roseibium sp. TaxID=1936156 RepID=UPI0026234A48|nr:N-acetyltransferase [Roseibium sp.]